MKIRGILGMAKRQEPKPSALEVIYDAEYSLVATQWKDVATIVQVRNLSEVQLLACGNFSLINLGELREGPFSWRQWVEYAEQNNKILKAALVSPSYEEVFALAGKGPSVKNAEARFREIDVLLLSMPRGPGRQALEKERDMLRCSYDLILPDDFIAPIVAYVVGIGRTDIKKITREMLLTATILAERGHNNPADHIDGIFSAFNRNDINRRGWQVLGEEREKSRRKVNHGC
jgi:hypothetical protein